MRSLMKKLVLFLLCSYVGASTVYLLNDRPRPLSYGQYLALWHQSRHDSEHIRFISVSPENDKKPRRPDYCMRRFGPQMGSICPKKL